MELKYWGDNKLNKNKKEISVYFANWNLDRLPAEQSGEVAGIPWDCVTNIKHAFWQVAPADGTTETSFERRDRGEAPRTEFTIKSMWQKNDMENQAPSAIDPSMPRNHFAQYKVFAKRYPDVEIMLSIGGWARCGYFSEMAYTREGRASFVQSCIDFMKEHTWTGGIDIDWEYPGCSTAGERLPDPADPDHDEGCPIWGTVEEDAANFTALMADLRVAMDAEFGAGVKKLTACCAGSTTTILPLQNWADAVRHMDRINIMSYDMSGVWDGVTGHHTSFVDTKKVVDYFAELGIPAEKLCIGTPFYALSFPMKEMDPKQIVGAPCDTYRASSVPVTERDLKAFEEEARSGYTLKKDGACWKMDESFDEGGKGWHFAHDDEVGAVYAYNDDDASKYYKWFLTYEDHLTLQKKLDYINEANIGGIIIWEVDQDTEDYAFMNQMADNLIR